MAKEGLVVSCQWPGWVWQSLGNVHFCFVQGIQEAIEFLVEQLQFGLHQATLPSGDVLPLSAETSTRSDAQPLAHKQRGHCSQFFLVRTAWTLCRASHEPRRHFAAGRGLMARWGIGFRGKVRIQNGRAHTLLVAVAQGREPERNT